MDASKTHELIVEWYESHFDMIYFYAKGFFSSRRVYASESEIEDIVQHTFLNVLERKKKDPIDNPEAYLIRTAQSLSIKLLDKIIKRGYRVEESVQNQIGQWSPKILAMEEKESQLSILNFIKNILTEQEVNIFYKRAVLDYSYEEIANEEGHERVFNLHTIYHRAKVKLQNHFQKKGKDQIRF